MAKKYSSFSAQDFAEDSFFIRWVKHPDEESDWFWQSFIREHPDKADDIRAAQEIISILNFKKHSIDDSSYESMRNRFLLSLREEKEKEQPVTHNRFTLGWKQILKVAAVFVILVAGVALYRSSDTVSAEPEQLANEESIQVGDTEERSNPRGQRSVLMLPDGSKVWLNSESKISYTKEFNRRNTRDVYLEGEAFFNVVHNESAPFIVHAASSIRIEVLGTSFNVKSYRNDQTVETTLVNGKVSIDKVEKDGQSSGNLILRPNQRAVYFKETNTLNVESVNASNLSAWRHDHLVFDETPLRDVFTQLERWYDIRIHVSENEDLECRLTANVQQESLENVLKLLETSHQIEYTISDKDVFIRGRLCNN